MKTGETKVICSKTFTKQLEKVPKHIKNKFMLWLFSVETIGIMETMKSKGFHDEPLKGERYGQRSVRLSQSYRLIYRLIDNYLRLELLEVHKHDY